MAGSSPAPYAPPGPGDPPTDIRGRVDQDRGFLKRLQLLVPGFRAYRVGEDLRAADSILRQQVGDKLHQALLSLNDARSTMTNSGNFAQLNDLGQITAEMNEMEQTIRHAAQGYTGISPAIRIRPESLEQLYQYDYGFALAGDQLSQSAAELRNQLNGGGKPDLPAAVGQLRDQVRQLKSAFQQRINIVEGIQVQ